ncbi:MAG: dTMP kinase [Chloroflexi bacterium]|nr:dTMP kinase [Chloroflexota bacterium]
MFITFEGIDGSGKTTQAQRLAAHLRAQGHDVLLTREPGGTFIGDQIREVLLKKSSEDAMHPRTELLLFCASRAQLVEEVLRPHLRRGGIVICDRYTDSTLAYQGYGHGLPLDTLKVILDFATGHLRPDMTFYFDITPQDALRRKRQASLFGEEWNRLDDMESQFYKRVYDGYRHLYSAEPKRWLRLDALGSIDAIFATLLEKLEARLAV